MSCRCLGAALERPGAVLEGLGASSVLSEIHRVPRDLHGGVRKSPRKFHRIPRSRNGSKWGPPAQIFLKDVCSKINVLEALRTVLKRLGGSIRAALESLGSALEPSCSRLGASHKPLETFLKKTQHLKPS